jgi:glycosyltransferase involved in cell wall biosynthesis
MVNVQKTILSVGYPSFPSGTAQVQRQLLLAKAILLEGYDVTVLCRYGVHNQNESVPAKGVFERINFIYCSGTSIRPDGYVKRNCLKLLGLLNEFKYIRRFSKTKHLAGILVSTNNFHNILFYYFIGKIFGTTITVDNVEYWTAIKSYRTPLRIEKYLYDEFYYLFTDRIICISDFLIGKVKESKRGVILKIPAITDFDKFSDSIEGHRLISEKYFLYCGSIAYFEVIDFIISSFDSLGFSKISLVLVTAENTKLRDRINRSKNKDSIKILTNLSYRDLVNAYKYSEALLIPLRNTDQDKARFPHKISEYCASCRPIITSYIGEIRNYFSEENAYLCPDFDESAYAIAMLDVISDPERANRIALKSYETGVVSFNYKSYSRSLINLLINK